MKKLIIVALVLFTLFTAVSCTSMQQATDNTKLTTFGCDCEYWRISEIKQVILKLIKRDLTHNCSKKDKDGKEIMVCNFCGPKTPELVLEITKLLFQNKRKVNTTRLFIKDREKGHIVTIWFLMGQD